MSVSSASFDLLQNFYEEFHSRRLLLHSPLQNPDSASSSNSTSSGVSRDNSFDTNVVMVLSVLLCALICSLGLNSIVRCALRCSTLVSSDSASSTRLCSTGVQRKALKTFTIINYSSELKHPGLDSECAICLSEFVESERIRLLPNCNHGFHVKCIDKWLSSHSSCPKCRHCLVVTCSKIVGCANPTPSEPPVLPQETVVAISPLHPEAFIRNYSEMKWRKCERYGR